MKSGCRGLLLKKKDEQVEGRRCGFSEVIWRPDEIVEDGAHPFASTVEEEGLECVDVLSS
jgi:hypothetical protein